MSPFAAFLDANARTLLTLLPALRDGRVDAVHDARVATRRLRAALGILEPGGDHSHLDEAAQLARRTARALGRVRDLDVALALLDDLERRAPSAAQAAAFCRQELVRDRTAARRRLVKKLDGLPLGRLPMLLRTGVPRLGHGLAVQARERADGVRRAVEHASGVYFPRRAHAARIEIKKLRYLIEFHDPSDTAALKVLRKAQEILGDIQDRQVVQAMVASLRDAQPSQQVDLAPLLSMLEAECVVLYDRFIERRADLLAVCERLASAQPIGRPRLVAGTLLSASAVVAGSMWQRRRSRAS
jgi:CHAD domain-containing protein